MNMPSLDNLRIGILGGSFNPAHEGHVHISAIARRTLALDRVIWLVARRNPFKPDQPPFRQRLESAQDKARASWITVSDMEDRLGLTHSFDILSFFCQRYKNTQFSFLMGADIFCQLPLWHRGRDIPNLMPLAIMPRRGHQRRARHSRLAAQLADHILPAAQIRSLIAVSAPAIAFITAPQCDMASSSLRSKAGQSI